MLYFSQFWDICKLRNGQSTKGLIMKPKQICHIEKQYLFEFKKGFELHVHLYLYSSLFCLQAPNYTICTKNTLILNTNCICFNSTCCLLFKQNANNKIDDRIIGNDLPNHCIALILSIYHFRIHLHCKMNRCLYSWIWSWLIDNTC